MDERFEDRRAAGRALAGLLTDLAGRDDVVVLALPRGGVPVGYEVARRLHAPLDVFVVRKLGVPGQEELAMGALASGGGIVLNERVSGLAGVTSAAIRRVAAVEGRELARRERTYRADRPPLDVAGQVVVVVDDGIATGSTVRAAVLALRERGPARIVVAVPVGSPTVRDHLAAVADEIVCVTVPPSFSSVGRAYADFAQTTDREVRDLLARAASPVGGR